jgi:uncharacterized protein YjbI with pentapeptide repeats
MKNNCKIVVCVAIVFFISSLLFLYSETVSPPNDTQLLHQWSIENGIYFHCQGFTWQKAWSNRYRDVPWRTDVFSGNRLIELSLREVTENRLDLSDFGCLKRLEFIHCRLSELQELVIPASLNELVFSVNEGLNVVDLQGFTSIKVLSMEQCNITGSKISNLPGGLVELNLSGNPALGKINLKKYQDLKCLYLSGCGINDLPGKNLPHSLEVLDISGNNDLSGVRLRELENLYLLDLRDCGISDLKDSVFPSSLVHLVLSKNLLRSVDFSGFQNLEVLDLSHCRLESAYAHVFPPSLKELHLEYNRELQSVTLEGLINLKRLFLYGSELYQPHIDLPTGLEELHLSHYKNLETIDLRKFKRLKQLTLQQCDLRNVGKLNLPISLVQLDLSGNEHLEGVRLGRLKNLKMLKLSRCGIRELNSSHLPASLVELDIDNCIFLTRINLMGLKNLKKVNLSGCDIRQVEVKYLPLSLNHIDLSCNSSLETVHIQGLLNLEKLMIDDCNITSLELSNLPQLEELDISGNKSLENFSLKGVTRLKILNASQCGILELNVGNLPSSIEQLELRDNLDLESVQLKDYPALKYISLCQCALSRVNLGQMPNLTELYLGNNQRLEQLELKDFPQLKVLELYQCNIKKLKLSDIPKLAALDLEGNRSLESISLPSLQELQLLRLSRCNLRELDLEGMTNLMTLDLSYCSRFSCLGIIGSKNLYRLILRECDLENLLPGFQVPSSVEELDIIPTSGIDRLNLKNLKKLKILRIDEQSRTLREVLLHPSNRAYPGITIIKYNWNEKRQELTEKFLDDQGRYVLHPTRKYALKITAYRNGIAGEPDPLNREQAEQWRVNNAPWPGWIFAKALLSSILGYFVLGLILLQVYPFSEKLQTKLKNTGLGIFIAPAVKFYIHFGRRVRLKLLAPFIETTLTADARLHTLTEEKYYPDSNVWAIVNGHQTKSQRISEVIQGVEGTMILEGQSGLGKTMFSKWLLNKLIADARKSKQAPVFLLASNCKTGVISAIKEKLSPSLFFNEQEIKDLLIKRVITVFIDGLNEAGAKIRENISSFVKEYNKCNIFITKQLIYWEKHKDTRVFEIKPLEKEQIKEFLVLKGESFNYEDIQVEDYKQKCSQWVDFNWPKLSDGRLTEVLANPMNLKLIATLIHQGHDPTKIQPSEFFRQLFDLIDKRYRELYLGKSFRLKELAGEITTWALKYGDYQYLENDICENYKEEIDIMLQFKVVSEQDGKYEFSHNKFTTFFLLTHLLEKKSWTSTHYIDNVHFNDVYLDLARQLPISEAEKLRELISLNSKDDTFIDEYIRVLEQRLD